VSLFGDRSERRKVSSGIRNEFDPMSERTTTSNASSSSAVFGRRAEISCPRT
jgi:hypothetical protein